MIACCPVSKFENRSTSLLNRSLISFIVDFFRERFSLPITPKLIEFLKYLKAICSASYKDGYQNHSGNPVVEGITV